MPRIRRWAGIVLLGATFTFHVTGCSLIGLGTGAILDARHRAPRTVPAARVSRFHPGDAMTLVLDDSTRVVGVYRRPGIVAASDYAPRYDAWRRDQPDAEIWPLLGERVRVPLAGENHFAGFAHGGIEVEWRGKTRIASYRESGDLTRSNGRRLPLATIRERVRSGSLPLVTILVIETSSGEREVPADRIAWVHAPGHPQGAKVGFFLGLTVDFAVLVAAASYHPEPLLGSGGCDYTGPSYY